jgi:hypothetical protein
MSIDVLFHCVQQPARTHLPVALAGSAWAPAFAGAAVAVRRACSLAHGAHFGSAHGACFGRFQNRSISGFTLVPCTTIDKATTTAVIWISSPVSPPGSPWLIAYIR